MSTFIKTLSGYSGCRIHLCDDNGRLFVRKLSCSEEYNPRMERQIQKQALFTHPILYAPTIYDTGYIDGKFYADMEYIDGETVAELIRNGEYEAARNAIYAVFTLFKPAENTVENAAEITQKLNSLQKSLSIFGSETPCRRTLDTLQQYTWQTHPTACHGDLTLENMIVKGGDVYLIDFLDTFHECLEADMAKLMQDLHCQWSFRHAPLGAHGKRLLGDCEEELCQLYTALTGSDAGQLYAMLRLTLLRIYPYVKDDYTNLFLDTQLIHMR